MTNQTISAISPICNSPPSSKFKPVFIYTLRDPRTGKVRYVGKTEVSVQERLKSHIYKATNPKSEDYNTHRCRWIRSIVKLGLEPIVEQVEFTVADWAERERYWVSQFLRAGASLTNSTRGGDGIFGLKHTRSCAKTALRQQGSG